MGSQGAQLTNLRIRQDLAINWIEVLGNWQLKELFSIAKLPRTYYNHRFSTTAPRWKQINSFRRDLYVFFMTMEQWPFWTFVDKCPQPPAQHSLLCLSYSYPHVSLGSTPAPLPLIGLWDTILSSRPGPCAPTCDSGQLRTAPLPFGPSDQKGNVSNQSAVRILDL